MIELGFCPSRFGISMFSEFLQSLVPVHQYTILIYNSFVCFLFNNCTSRLLEMAASLKGKPGIHDLWPTLPLRVYFSVSFKNSNMEHFLLWCLPRCLAQLNICQSFECLKEVTFMLLPLDIFNASEIIEGKWGGQFGQFGSLHHWGAEVKEYMYWDKIHAECSSPQLTQKTENSSTESIFQKVTRIHLTKEPIQFQ